MTQLVLFAHWRSESSVVWKFRGTGPGLSESGGHRVDFLLGGVCWVTVGQARSTPGVVLRVDWSGPSG